MNKGMLTQDTIDYLRKAQFRLEVIEDALEDLGQARLVGAVRASWSILLNVERALIAQTSGDDDE